jgi:tetratricopeptide (TPR) repeat protein
LGEAYWRTKQGERAVQAYRDAIARRPSYARAFGALGECLLRLGRAREAIEWLEKAPDDPHVLNTLGVAYGQAGRIDDSYRVLTRASKLRPDLPLTWLNLGVTHEHRNDRAAAEKAYLEAIRLQPDFEQAHQHLANLRSQK